MVPIRTPWFETLPDGRIRERFRIRPRLVWAATATLLLLAAPSASAMSVAEFLARAHALQAQGPFAPLSPDMALLRREVMRIAAAYRADLAAARATGRTPHSCPPRDPHFGMTATQLIAELERIPVARRSVSLKSALYAMMRRRFPCRARVSP